MRQEGQREVMITQRRVLPSVAAHGSCTTRKTGREPGWAGHALLVGSLVLFALWLRLYLARGGTFGSDVDDWILWSRALNHGSLATFYARTHSDYLPGYLWILRLLGAGANTVPALIAHLPDIGDGPTTALVTYYKLPTILADVATIVVLYVAGCRWSDVRPALLVATVYALNPAIIMDSARWGQVDAVGALTLVLAVIFLVEDRPLACGIFLAASLMTKPTAIVLIPLIVVAYGCRGRMRRMLTTFGACGVACLAIAWPFTPAYVSPIAFLPRCFETTASRWPVTTSNAFNLWALLDRSVRQGCLVARPDAAHWLGVSVHAWGFVLLIAVALAVSVVLVWAARSVRRAASASVVVSGVATLALAFFLVLTRMHERHMFPALTLLALLCAVRPRYWLIYAVLSLDYVLNLQYAYPCVAYFPVPAVAIGPIVTVAAPLVNIVALLACLALLPVPWTRLPHTVMRTVRRENASDTGLPYTDYSRRAS